MTNSVKKSANITGASGGIGGEVARRVLRDGFGVIIHYAGKPAPAQAVVAELKAAGGQAISVQADAASVPDVECLFKESIDAFGNPTDVSSQESCNAAVQEIIAKTGRLDVVIHNAGHMVFGPDAIVKVVDTPFGKRPFRVHYDPTQDGAEVVNMVSDRVRAELLRRIGLTDVLTPRDFAVQSKSAA